ncbi:TSSK4 [Branchiostoma lanceolatum]|uniref:non-specific serine/threonine protein kinase n=1 Tax=Branchiostoma lanceolatum TaxID=7740 RepID=A0A8K0A8Y8_BRALA|nr:TSSK4 [Branchiostoma lanceolatum]
MPNSDEAEKNHPERAKSTTSRQVTVLESHGFLLGPTLGHGSYAAVKAAYSNRHKCKVAIKIVSKKRAPNDYIQKFLPREIDVIKILKHRSLICFLQSIETTSRVYLVMEVAENGDLLDRIKSKSFIPEPQAGLWFHQLLDGLDYCHRKGVAHRDLKCENILLDGKDHIKITDFGFARGDLEAVDGRAKLSETYCGSYAYAPPEILKGVPYDPFVADVWSLGVVLFTMMYGRLPYDDSNHRTLLHQVQNPVVFPNAKHSVSEDCKTMINKILSSAKRRLYIDGIRRTGWCRRVAPTHLANNRRASKAESGKGGAAEAIKV